MARRFGVFLRESHCAGLDLSNVPRSCIGRWHNKRDQNTAGRRHQCGLGSREKAEAARKQAEQSLQLAESDSDWRSPNKSLEDLRKIDQITQDRLNDTKITLDEVRNNLSSTRNDLTQQSAANQVTSLANAGQDIREIVLVLPLTSRARASAKFREAFLPSFELSACRDLTGIEFRFATDESELRRNRSSDER